MARLYESSQFRDWFVASGRGNPRTYFSYKSYLGQIDRALEGGLDVAFDQQGAEGLLHWARTSTETPFDKYPSSLRAALKRYVQFRLDEGLQDEAIVEEAEDNTSVQTSIFQLEQQMQTAVRQQLSSLEEGLTEADGGVEQLVSTGRIDILARDRNDRLVIIELKAGRCPPSALEQALGYAQSLYDERSENARVILIASEFSERTRAAAKRVADLSLVEYRFSMNFQKIA